MNIKQHTSSRFPLQEQEMSVAEFTSKTIGSHIPNASSDLTPQKVTHAVTVVDIFDECVSSVGAAPSLLLAPVATTFFGFETAGAIAATVFPVSSRSPIPSLGSDVVNLETADASAL